MSILITMLLFGAIAWPKPTIANLIQDRTKEDMKQDPRSYYYGTSIPSSPYNNKYNYTNEPKEVNKQNTSYPDVTSTTYSSYDTKYNYTEVNNQNTTSYPDVTSTTYSPYDTKYNYTNGTKEVNNQNTSSYPDVTSTTHSSYDTKYNYTKFKNDSDSNVEGIELSMKYQDKFIEDFINKNLTLQKEIYYLREHEKARLTNELTVSNSTNTPHSHKQKINHKKIFISFIEEEIISNDSTVEE